MRGLFEISLKEGSPAMTYNMLAFCKSVDHRMWPFEHPLKQFAGDKLTPEILHKLMEKKATLPILRDMTHDEIGTLQNYKITVMKVSSL